MATRNEWLEKIVENLTRIGVPLDAFICDLLSIACSGNRADGFEVIAKAGAKILGPILTAKDIEAPISLMRKELRKAIHPSG